MSVLLFYLFFGLLNRASELCFIMSKFKKKNKNSRLDLSIDVFQWFCISKCQFFFILVIVCDCSKTNRQTLIEKGVLRQVNILSNYILSMADFKEIRVGYLQLYLEILI